MNSFLRILVLPVTIVCASSMSLFADDEIPPVRVGDEVEVQSLSKWYPGTVESYQDGAAMVRYKRGSSIERTDKFELQRIRFPNNEGHWMIWKDASGSFRVEARYISRTEADVTIRKVDGSQVTVPIESLHATLRKQVAQTPVSSDITKPVHVGDQVEVKYFSKWYDGTVKLLQDEQVTVEFESTNSRVTTYDFRLTDIRFPNGEGHWMIWKDASGEFKVEARYISRTESEVTIRKIDGSEVTIPIANLQLKLRQQIAKTPITKELTELDGAIPIRVGDRVQAKVGFSWHDGTIKEVRVGAASVEYKQGAWGLTTSNFELKDIRYPNGEGPWREWSDSSGNFKIIARYLARDETHVNILKEDYSEIRVPIAGLSADIKKLLDQTPIVARRPPLVALAGAELLVEVAGSRLPLAQRMLASRGSAGVPDLAGVSTQTGTPVSQQTVRLPSGGVAFATEPRKTSGKVVPIGGSEGWVLVSTQGDRWSSNDQLTTLHWCSLAEKKTVVGPSFYPDQRLIAYSADQQRAVLSSVKGSWDEPYQLSTYRISPGDASARSEITLDLPKEKYAIHREPIVAELIGDRMMLLGYGGRVSLWDLEERRVIYQVGDLTSHCFCLSIDHRYFAVRNASTVIGLYDLPSGDLIGQGSWEGYGHITACFSDDGKHLTAATTSGMYRWDLTGRDPMQLLPIGGIHIDRNMPLADLSGGWLVAGPQVYSSGLGLIVWRYDGGDVTIQHQQMLGRQMLVAATAGGSSGKSVLVGVATVPHDDAIEMMKRVDPNAVRMLVRGSRIKVDTSVDRRILDGLRRAAERNGWIEDPSSEAILTGSAERGETQELTFRVVGAGSLGQGEETHNVAPWIQKAYVHYRGKTAWSAAVGGVPWSFSVREGQTLGGELQKSSNPSYGLFENLKIPEEIIYPRYQSGLGQTLLTPSGFVDKEK